VGEKKTVILKRTQRPGGHNLGNFFNDGKRWGKRGEKLFRLMTEPKTQGIQGQSKVALTMGDLRHLAGGGGKGPSLHSLASKKKSGGA